MFVRVWEYTVPPEQVDAFTAVYGPDGDWVQLFGQGQGYAGTQLYRDVVVPERFVTVDRWSDQASWEAFLATLGAAYEALDIRTERLTAHERCLLEGHA